MNESPLQALVQAVNAILQPSQNLLLQALQRLRLCIQDITRTLGQMHGMRLLKAEGFAREDIKCQNVNVFVLRQPNVVHATEK